MDQPQEKSTTSTGTQTQKVDTQQDGMYSLATNIF